MQTYSTSLDVPNIQESLIELLDSKHEGQSSELVKELYKMEMLTDKVALRTLVQVDFMKLLVSEDKSRTEIYLDIAVKWDVSVGYVRSWVEKRPDIKNR